MATSEQLQRLADRNKSAAKRIMERRVLTLGANMRLDRDVLRKKVLQMTQHQELQLMHARWSVIPWLAPLEEYRKEAFVIEVIDNLITYFPSLQDSDIAYLVGIGSDKSSTVPEVSAEYRRDMSLVDKDVIRDRCSLEILKGTTPYKLMSFLSSSTGLSLTLSRLLVIEVLGVPTEVVYSGGRRLEERRNLPLKIPSVAAVNKFKTLLLEGYAVHRALRDTGWQGYDMSPYAGVYTPQYIPDGLRVSSYKITAGVSTADGPTGDVVPLPKSDTVTGGLWPSGSITSLGGTVGSPAGGDKYVADMAAEHERYCGVNETLRVATLARAEAIGAASRKDTAAAEEARCVWKQAVMDLDLMGFDFDAAQDVLEDDDKWKARMAAATTHESRWSRFKRWCRQWL